MTDTPSDPFQTGLAAWRDGRVAEAEVAFRQAVTADPDNAAALYNLGLVCFHGGKVPEAETALTKAHELRPDHIDTQAILSAVLVDMGHHARAVALASAVARESDEPAHLNTAGHVIAACGQPDAAEAAYRKALDKDHGYRPSVLPLVNLLMARQAYDDAADVCEQALNSRPTDQDLHLKRCQALWDGGHWQRARHALQDLLEFAPDHVTALYNLSLYADHDDPASAIARLSVLISEGDLVQDDLEKAWFALGNLYAQAQDYDSSMACFSAGNTARAQRANRAHEISAEAFEKRVSDLIKSPRPVVEQIPVGAPVPIVITGPSRSGKSLLQACLSGHPDIGAADETGMLPRLAAEIDMTSKTQVAEAAASYRSGLRRVGGDAPYVIDTHPVNALYLDLLVAMCPDALIIQMERHPLDLAVCVYVRHYVTGGHWADTWPGIARRLKSYARVNEFWSGWDPVKASTSYEALVTNPEETLRLIVDRLGLAWSDTVLPDHADPSGVRNMPWASFPQDRAIHKDRAELWQPFSFALGDFAEAYGRGDLPEVPAPGSTKDQPHIAALAMLSTSSVDVEDLPETINSLPVVEASRAGQAEAAGDWALQ